MARDGNRVALTAFLALSVLAGGNAVGVKFSNEELDPIWGATLRFSLAAALLMIVLGISAERFPRGRALVGATLYGLFAFGAGFALAFYALVELEAGFGQIILAIVPLLTVLLAVVERQEKLKLTSVLGSLVALSGIVVMTGLTLEGAIPLLPILAAVGAAACFAQGTVIVRWYPEVGPLAFNAVGSTVGSIFLAGLALIVGNDVVFPVSAQTWAAIAYMVVIGTAVVFSLYVFVLKVWEASRVAYSFVLVPVFTVLASAWLLDEPIGSGLLVGGALVLVGVYVGALRGHAAR